MKSIKAALKAALKARADRMPYFDLLAIAGMPRARFKVLEHQQIWQCATPKSASTYLTKILSTLWANDCVRGAPGPYYNDRCQEPDGDSVCNAIRRSRKPYYSGHHHQRDTTFFQNYFLNNQGSLG